MRRPLVRRAGLPVTDASDLSKSYAKNLPRRGERVVGCPIPSEVGRTLRAFFRRRERLGSLVASAAEDILNRRLK